MCRERSNMIIVNTAKGTVEVSPKFAHVGPEWWHSHGDKMRLFDEVSTKDRVVIRGSASGVVI